MQLRTEIPEVSTICSRPNASEPFGSIAYHNACETGNETRGSNELTETTKAAAPHMPLVQFVRQRPAFSSFVAIRVCDELASQMLNVAVGWYVYSATHNPMSLAYVGLARFLPKMVVLPFAGQAADRFDRRKLVGAALVVQTLFLAIFSFWLTGQGRSVAPIYVLLAILSSAHACFSPAMSAMLPRLVSGEDFPRAVAVASSSFQITTIAGPAIGGLIYAVNGRAAFVVATFFSLLAATQVARLKLAQQATQSQAIADRSVLAGLRYVFSNRLILALISLDLFAVLFGGADGAFADLRERRPRGWSGWAWKPQVRSQRGSGGGRPVLGTQDDHSRSGQTDARLRRRLWSCDDRLCDFNKSRAFARGFDSRGRVRHGEHGDSPDPCSDFDPGRNERQGECSELCVHRRVQRVGRV